MNRNMNYRWEKLSYIWDGTDAQTQVNTVFDSLSHLFLNHG